jgi:VanZ family protein
LIWLPRSLTARLIALWSLTLLAVCLTIVKALLPEDETLARNLPQSWDRYNSLLWDLRHFGAFISVAALSYRALIETPHGDHFRTAAARPVLVGCLILATFTEAAQSFSPGHVTSLWDFLVDMSGASIGALVSSLLRWRRWLRHSPDPRTAGICATVFVMSALVVLSYYLLGDRIPPS